MVCKTQIMENKKQLLLECLTYESISRLACGGGYYLIPLDK